MSECSLSKSDGRTSTSCARRPTEPLGLRSIALGYGNQFALRARALCGCRTRRTERPIVTKPRLPIRGEAPNPSTTWGATTRHGNLVIPPWTVGSTTRTTPASTRRSSSPDRPHSTRCSPRRSASPTSRNSARRWCGSTCMTSQTEPACGTAWLAPSLAQASRGGCHLGDGTQWRLGSSDPPLGVPDGSLLVEVPRS